MLKKAKRLLYLFHRWLGVVLCVWFALLFASGIIMMYVEYPELTEEERLWQMDELNATAVHLAVSKTCKHSRPAGVSIDRSKRKSSHSVCRRWFCV